MSLINDVLCDLQRRQKPLAQPLAGLTPVRMRSSQDGGAPSRSARARRPVLLGVALVLAGVLLLRTFPGEAPAPPLSPVTSAAVTAVAAVQDDTASARAAPATGPSTPATTIGRLSSLEEFLRSRDRLAQDPPRRAPGPVFARERRPVTQDAADPAPQATARTVTEAQPTEPVAALKRERSAARALVPASVIVTRPADGPSVEARRRAALAALHSGRPREAVRDLRALLVEFPGDTQGWLHLATALAHAGEPGEALAALRSGLHRADEPATIARQLARRLVAADAEAEALDVLLAHQPEPPVAEHESFIAALEQRSGRHGAAAARYRRLLDADGARPAWWLGLAISEDALGNPAAALTAYRRARTMPLEPALDAYASARIATLDAQLTAP